MVCTGQQIHTAWEHEEYIFSQTWCRPKAALNLGLSWGYNNFRWIIMLFFVCWMWKQSGLNLDSKGERMLECPKFSGFWIVKHSPPHFSNTRSGCPHLFETYSTPGAPDPCEWTQNYSYLKCDTVKTLKTLNFTAPNRMHNKLLPRLEAFPSINVLATFLLNKSSSTALSMNTPRRPYRLGKNKC